MQGEIRPPSSKARHDVVPRNCQTPSKEQQSSIDPSLLLFVMANDAQIHVQCSQHHSHGKFLVVVSKISSVDEEDIHLLDQEALPYHQLHWAVAISRSQSRDQYRTRRRCLFFPRPLPPHLHHPSRCLFAHLPGPSYFAIPAVSSEIPSKLLVRPSYEDVNGVLRESISK